MVDDPDSSIFKNPTINMGGMNRYTPRMIDHKISMPSIEVTSPIIGACMVKTNIRG